jgi:hypothetical protein
LQLVLKLLTFTIDRPLGKTSQAGGFILAFIKIAPHSPERARQKGWLNNSSEPENGPTPTNQRTLQ